MGTYQELYKTSMGDPVTAKPAGSAMDPATLAELDKAVFKPLPGEGILSAGASVTNYGMGFLGLAFTVSAGLKAKEQAEQKYPVQEVGQKAWEFHDILGDFHVETAAGPWQEFKSFFNDTNSYDADVPLPRKQYFSGALYDEVNNDRIKHGIPVGPVYQHIDFGDQMDYERQRDKEVEGMKEDAIWRYEHPGQVLG